MFKHKKTEAEKIKEVMKDWDVDYHYKHLAEALANSGYTIHCLKLRKICKPVVLEEC